MSRRRNVNRGRPRRPNRRAQEYRRAKSLLTGTGIPIKNISKKYSKSKTGDWLKLNEKLQSFQNVISSQEEEKEDPYNTYYDYLIGTNKFQQLLDFFIEYDLPLNSQQAGNFLNKLLEQDKYFSIGIKLKNRIEPATYFNVGAETRRYLLDVLQTGFIEEVLTTSGSNNINSINYDQIEKWIIEETPRPQRISRGGGFFHYKNTTLIDLSRYQIFQDELPEKMEHCLIHTLKLAGIKEAHLQSLKLTLKTYTYINKSNLQKIADNIKCSIYVYEYKTSREKIKPLKYKYGDDSKIVHIGLFEHHYFIYEKTKYSTFFINNYETIIKDEKVKTDRYERIYGKDKNLNVYLYKPQDFHKNGNQGMNVLKLIKTLFNNGYMKKHVWETNAESVDAHLDEIPSLKYYDENNCTFPEPTQPNNEQAEYYFADCETFVNKGKHELFLLASARLDPNYFETGVEHQRYKKHVYIHKLGTKWLSTPQKVVDNFIRSMIRNTDLKRIVVYFHNLKYDFNIILPYLKYCGLRSYCKSGGTLYSVKLKYKGYKIELRDSYKLIPFALSKFNKSFNLGDEYSKKEAIAYKFYTIENSTPDVALCLKEDYMKFLPKDEIPIFLENYKNYTYYDRKTKTEYFCHVDYYIDYLRMDCLTLKYGLLKMRQIVHENICEELDLFESLTISTLTQKYLEYEGVYEDVCSTKGLLRRYLGHAVYGGRVFVNPKYKKKVIEEKIGDMDVSSLYPSACFRLCEEYGIPKGIAKVMTEEQKLNWKTLDYCVMTIKIKSVGKKQQIPFIVVKQKGENLKNTNEPPKDYICVVDKYTLEDYIEFHKIEFDLIEGVCWTDGFNKSLGQVIKNLYDVRLKFKDKSSPNFDKAKSEVIKLMLNSIYGKTIQKLHMERYRLKNNKEFKTYLSNNFNNVKTFKQLNDYTYEILECCLDDSSNRAHIGVSILSMSKRIMNEVFNIANDNNFPIYYTDTDSIHCNYNDIDKIGDIYKNNYGKQLIGTYLGQFHNDFDMNGAVEDIYAIKSIFLGKKSYCDVIESKDKDGNIINDMVCRLKGITVAGIKYTSKKFGGEFNLYKELATGKEVKILLNPFDVENNKEYPLFNYPNSGGVETQTEFYRTLCF